jgi:hypothetical protein
MHLEPVAGSCEDGNEPSHSIQGKEFIDPNIGFLIRNPLRELIN